MTATSTPLGQDFPKQVVELLLNAIDEAKKAEIQDLKKDSDKSIQRFATEYESYLNERIVFEQKRTNEQIELMKRGLN